MFSSNVGALCKTCGRALFRALTIGPAAALAGGLFGVACGAILCVFDGLPWATAGGWGLRGALGGLAAGAVMGALSGVYHVAESPRPSRAASPTKVVAVSEEPRRSLTHHHNGVRRRA